MPSLAEAAVPLRRGRWVLLALGAAGAVAAAVAAGGDAGAAARQDWPPFVLVAGLLLIGQVASADGLFQAAGHAIGGRTRRGPTLLAAAALLVAVVTAVLNLDTSVAFLTPVLVFAARRRRLGEAPLLYLSLFLANGASLLLPGSNLTNLIVIGRHPVAGTSFALHMLAPWVAVVIVVPLVVGLWWRAALRGSAAPPDESPVRPRLGVGAAGVVVAVIAVLVLSPAPMALVVAGAGLVAAGWRAAEGRLGVHDALTSLNLPLLAALLGTAVALGTLGAAWAAPAHYLEHAGTLETALVGGAASVVVNNLPAASFLAVRVPRDPYALLIGLNLGPNLVVTGALSGILWLQVGRQAGAAPSAWRVTRLGVVVVPISMAIALGALVLLG